MDNSGVQREGRLLGNSKLYGGNRQQHGDWRRFGDSRMLEHSRSPKDSQLQGSPRQRGDFRMQGESRIVESRMQPNYLPSRLSGRSEIQGNVRMQEDRMHEDSGLIQDMRPHQDSRLQEDARMQSSARMQGNSHFYEDVQAQEQLRSRSDTYAFDYNHRPPDDLGPPLKDVNIPSSHFMPNSQESMRSGRSGYNIQRNDPIKSGYPDMLPNLSNVNPTRKNMDLLPPKNFSHEAGIPLTSSGHILTPSLTSPSEPQYNDGSRGSYQKSSKAFDYLKSWRLKMNMPTDAFLLEKESLAASQQQSNVHTHAHSHSDFYSQPPNATTRTARTTSDLDGNFSSNPFAEKAGYGERPANKYGEARLDPSSESQCQREPVFENDRTYNQAWKWDRGLPSTQSHGAKRDYDSMTSGQTGSYAHRDGHILQTNISQAKRPRLSPSLMQTDRGEPLDQYRSLPSQQEVLSQNNAPISDNIQFKVNIGDTFYDSPSDWKDNASFHRRPSLESNKFARSPIESHSHSSDMKGMMLRGRSPIPYSQFGHVKDISDELSNKARSPESLVREKYTDPHFQGRGARLSGRGRSPDINQNSFGQGRQLSNEINYSAASYLREKSPRPYPRGKSHRSPIKGKSPGFDTRGKSPESFNRRKSPVASPRGKYPTPHARGKSPLLSRKGKSPVPSGRGRSPGPSGRRKSPGPSGRGRSSGPLGRGRSPGPSGRGRSPVPSGRGRSPGPIGRGRPADLRGGKSPERSPEPNERGRPVGPSGRMRSPGPSGRMRSPGPCGRMRSPGPSGRMRSPGPAGRMRSPGPSGRMRSPGPSARMRSPGPSKRIRSPGPSGRERSPVPSGRGKPLGSGRERLPGLSGRGRSPGPTARGRSPGSFVRELSPGRPLNPSERKLPEPSGRERLSGSFGRDNSPSQRSSEFHGRGRSPGPTRRGLSPSSFGRGKASGRALDPSGRRSRSFEREKVASGRSIEANVRQPGPSGSGPSGPPGLSRKGRSPGPSGRGRSPGPPRKGRSPGPSGRGRSPVTGPSGRGRSPVTGPSGRGRSPVTGPSGRGRSPVTGPSGRGRSPVTGPSGRGRSPIPGSSGRGRSPGTSGRGRSPGPSARGRSPGPPARGRSPGPPARGRSPGPSARGRSPGPPARGRSPGPSARGRSPGPRERGKPAETGRGRPSKPPITRKPVEARTKEKSPGLVSHGSLGRPRLQSPPIQGVAAGVNIQRSSRGISPIRYSRGRSPFKVKSPGNTRLRSPETFSQGNPRTLMRGRSPRPYTRSSRSPMKRLVPGSREKGESPSSHEYKNFRMEKRERSPYLEEVSLSPKSNGHWSPGMRKELGARSPHHDRNSSQSLDALQRGCSPVSVQSGDYPVGQNLFSHDPYHSEREGHLLEHSPQLYRGFSPLPLEGYSTLEKSQHAEAKSNLGKDKARPFQSSRDMAYNTPRHSTERTDHAKGNRRENYPDKLSDHYNGKETPTGKSQCLEEKHLRSDRFPADSMSNNKHAEEYREVHSGEEEVDDEDLRIHLLRLREQKVELKLMKLEEESIETEFKLWKLQKSQTVYGDESPKKEERKYPDKEHGRPYRRRNESQPHAWKYQHSPEREKYHRGEPVRQHKRY